MPSMLSMFLLVFSAGFVVAGDHFIPMALMVGTVPDLDDGIELTTDGKFLLVATPQFANSANLEITTTESSTSDLFSMARCMIDCTSGIAEQQIITYANGVVMLFTGTVNTSTGSYVAGKIVFVGDPEHVSTAEQMLEELLCTALGDGETAVAELLETIMESNVTINVVAGHPNIPIGSFPKTAIDITDIEAFPYSGAGGYTQLGNFLHEIVENYEHQINGLPFGPAHEIALQVQGDYTDTQLVSQGQPVIDQTTGNVTVTSIWVENEGGAQIIVTTTLGPNGQANVLDVKTKIRIKLN